MMTHSNWENLSKFNTWNYRWVIQDKKFEGYDWYLFLTKESYFFCKQYERSQIFFPFLLFIFFQLVPFSVLAFFQGKSIAFDLISARLQKLLKLLLANRFAQLIQIIFQRLVVPTVIPFRLRFPKSKFVINVKLPVFNHFRKIFIQNLIFAIDYFCLD